MIRLQDDGALAGALRAGAGRRAARVVSAMALGVGLVGATPAMAAPTTFEFSGMIRVYGDLNVEDDTIVKCGLPAAEYPGVLRATYDTSRPFDRDENSVAMSIDVLGPEGWVNVLNHASLPGFVDSSACLHYVEHGGTCTQPADMAGFGDGVDGFGGCLGGTTENIFVFSSTVGAEEGWLRAGDLPPDYWLVETWRSIAIYFGGLDGVFDTWRIVTELDVALVPSVYGDLPLGTPLTLDALAFGVDPDTASWNWSCSGGLEPTQGAQRQTFEGLAHGDYTCTVTASDAFGMSGSDSYTWRVVSKPVAVLVPSALGDVLSSEVFTLDGSASNDPDGTIVDYRWICGAATGDLLAVDQGEAAQAFVGLAADTYACKLTVTDNDGYTDSVIYTWRVMTPPTVILRTASAGLIQIGSTVTVDARDSYDEGWIVGYTWQCTDPDGVSLATTGGVEHTFEASKAGTYTCIVTAFDNDGLSGFESISWTVESNQAPYFQTTNPVRGSVTGYYTETVYTFSFVIKDPEGYEARSTPNPWRLAGHLTYTWQGQNYYKPAPPTWSVKSDSLGNSWIEGTIDWHGEFPTLYALRLEVQDNYGATIAADWEMVLKKTPTQVELIVDPSQKLRELLATCTGGDSIDDKGRLERACHMRMVMTLEMVILRLVESKGGGDKELIKPALERELEVIGERTDGSGSFGPDWVLKESLRPEIRRQLREAQDALDAY